MNFVGLGDVKMIMTMKNNIFYSVLKKKMKLLFSNCPCYNLYLYKLVAFCRIISVN